MPWPDRLFAVSNLDEGQRLEVPTSAASRARASGVQVWVEEIYPEDMARVEQFVTRRGTWENGR